MAAELLAPAGNLDRLRWAVAYGADAVYFGIEQFSLRSFAGNFSLEDAQVGLDYLHRHGRRGYITLNIYPFSEEYEDLERAALALDEMGADALIVADLGVIHQLSRLGLRAHLHVSTQANTTSYQTVLAYRDLGAARVNLARELSLDQIREIQRRLDGQSVETEVFVHGSVCFSYSGRCAISDYLTGRRANRGECTHPCRWEYSLVEEKRPGQYFPVAEDERGLYLFNSRDLALFPFVRELVDSGVASLKIEGRMKNAHYLASVLSVYRRILDGCPLPEQDAWRMLGRVENRGFSYGFMDGRVGEADYELDTHRYRSSSLWVAATTDDVRGDHRICRVKNTVHAGEELEMLSPGTGISTYRMPSALRTSAGTYVDRANNQDTILLDAQLPPYSILRRVKVGPDGETIHE